MSRRIWIRRAYEPASPVDRHRVLVDRLWPRGISKSQLRVDTWASDIAPSVELRHWFGRDPTRWDEFRTRYGVSWMRVPTRQLSSSPPSLTMPRADASPSCTAHRDTQHNNAVVLREFIEEHTNSPTLVSGSTPGSK